jgi:hypothetical protein
MERLFPDVTGLNEYRERLRSITKETNQVLFDFVRTTGLGFSDGIPPTMDAAQLSKFCDQAAAESQFERDWFIRSNQHRMLVALGRAA